MIEYWVLRKIDKDQYALVHKARYRMQAQEWITTQPPFMYKIEEHEIEPHESDDHHEPVKLRFVEAMLVIAIFVVLPVLFTIYKIWTK